MSESIDNNNNAPVNENAPEVKPEVKPEGESINIKVIYDNGSDKKEMVFKIKKTTKFGKLIDAFCQRNGLDKNSMKFQSNGVRIYEDHTPLQHDIEDGDQIDCFVTQTGGDSSISYL